MEFTGKERAPKVRRAWQQEKQKRYLVYRVVRVKKVKLFLRLIN
jgi:hypothetical protein